MEDASKALTEERVAEYADYRTDELKNSGATLNRHMSAIRVLMKEGVKRKIIPERFDIQIYPEGQARLRVFERMEEDAIVSLCRLWGRPNEADLFSFLADTGLRLGEAESLSWSDWNKDTGIIVVEGVNSKNGEQRVVGLTPKATEVLINMGARFREHTTGPFAWHRRDSTRHLWKRLRAHLEWMGDDCVIHTFRHTCLSRLVRNGASLFAVQKWAGHKSPLMTQRYAKFAPRDMKALADLLSNHPTPTT